MGFRPYIWLTAGVLLVDSPSALAQSFSFTKVIDANTPRPDGQGNFQNPHGPSTDGRYVVWSEEAGDLSVWSADLNTLTFTRLADTSTTVPGGTGNFTALSQIGGGPYSSFNVIVRNGTAVFTGSDSAGNGLYSVAATGGPIQRVVNYKVTLPNGGVLGAPGHQVYAFGVNDAGAIVFTGLPTGNAPDGTALGDSVYTAAVDGSHLVLIADEDHLFSNPLQASGRLNSCVMNFGTVAIGGNSVVYSGAGGFTFWGIYSLPIAGPVQGASPANCGNGPKGPLVLGSGTPLPGDPTPAKQVPAYDFIQTDGTNVYFHGYDFTIGCCSSTGGAWGGIFSVPLAGGPVTKIVANGDTLPSLGQVTNIQTEFSVDNGGVVFIALNESVTPTRRGIFLYGGGQISKVFVSGDSLNGGTLTQNGSLEVWPQSYKNGKIAFEWIGGVYVAAQLMIQSAADGVTALAQGSLSSMFAVGLATGTASAQPPWPTMLNGTQVTIVDSAGVSTAAPMFYVSPTQINFYVPPSVAAGPATVTIMAGNGAKVSSQVNILPVAPALFTLNTGGLAAAVAVCGQADGSQTAENVYQIVNGAFVAAPLNLGACSQTALMLFATGMDAATVSNTQLTMGGAPVSVIYAGPQGVYTGLDQINVVIPQSLAGAGNVPIAVTVSGHTSNTVNVTIQ